MQGDCNDSQILDKAFCFFFSKKKALLSSSLPMSQSQDVSVLMGWLAQANFDFCVVR